MIYDNILQAIGNTPIVKLNRVTEGCKAEVYAKLEFMNPGGSIKDRIGWYLIEDAEKRGVLKPGGTIIEGTSGNTGVGLAITAAIKGYNCIFVLPDKMSQEKIMNLRSFGAKVEVTPTAVEPEDPRSYYSVSRRLAEETPNSLYIDQYNNLANRQCHIETTGPEILKQMPDIDVFIAGIGTGGTVCGIGTYLKKNKPDCKVVAVDPIGSIVYDKFHGRDVPADTYLIEGIGEDFIPKNYDFSVIDDMVQVADKESFLMTRDILKKEGIYSGVSSGSAVVGAMRWLADQGDAVAGKKVLIMIPDSGNRYLSKVYNDEWMREAGFLDEPALGTVGDLLCQTGQEKHEIQMARQNDQVSTLIDLMKSKGISQVPVQDANGWIKGIATETAILNAVYEGRLKPSDPIEKVMNPGVEFVTRSTPIEKVSQWVSQGKIPLVSDTGEGDKIIAIITKIDLLAYLGSRR